MLSLKHILSPFFWLTASNFSPVAFPMDVPLTSPTLFGNKLTPYHNEPNYRQYLGLSTLKPPLLPWKRPQPFSFINFQNERAKEGDSFIQDIISYQANDSITYDVKEQRFDVYGASSIGYENMTLIADHISLEGNTGKVIARGKTDEKGQIRPKPIFKQDNQIFIAEEFQYNLNSKRGTAKRLFTQQQEALIQCKKAKMDSPDTYYADRVKFTTCNLTKPHYFVKARRVKYLKDTSIASGPFQFYFDGVPTALGFFYGLFFIPREKSSGILAPSIGEDGKKGFYLKEGGYYVYFNDYIDLALRGSIYSKGHSNFLAESKYKKRYSFNGQISYKQEITANTTELALQEDKEKEWRFTWTNQTENNRVSSLTADVDIQSRSKRHSLQTIGKSDKLNAKTQSKVRYKRKILGTPYSINTSAAHSKDFKNDLTQVTFPEIMLATTSIYPTRWITNQSSQLPQVIQEINFNHTSEFQTKFSNATEGDTLEFSRKNWPTIAKNSQYGFQHKFPIETNFKLFKFFSLKPAAKYTERWYFKRYDYSYDSLLNEITADTVTGFNRVWDYQLSSSLQTTVYGTHFFSEQAYLKAIRHRIEPSLGLSYHPDFSKKEYGYYQTLQTKQGEQKLDKFKGNPYGTPPKQASALLEIQINNIVEVKKQRSEDPKKENKKIPLAESIYGKTTYDFLADSFRLGDLEFGARNRFFDTLINVEYTSKYDPYIYVNRRRVEEFAWQHGKGLGIMKEYTFKIGTHLQSEKYDIKPDLNDESKKKTELDIQNEEEESNKPAPKQQEPTILLDSSQYVDFDLPWQFDVAYQQIFTYNIPLDKSEKIRQIVFSADLNITKSWKTVFSSVYDIDKKELVGSATKVGIYRDLHCWQMKFDWVPLADTQSYDFSIGLKAQLLEDVKLPHSREYEKV